MNFSIFLKRIVSYINSQKDTVTLGVFNSGGVVIVGIKVIQVFNLFQGNIFL